MNFFKKGIEYHNMAKSINGLVPMIGQLERKLKNGNAELTDEIYLLSYLGRKEILDRIAEYKWNLGTPIVVPALGGKSTLLFAYQMTITKLMVMAEQIGLSSDVNDILGRGELYFELDKSIPNHLKNLI